MVNYIKKIKLVLVFFLISTIVYSQRRTIKIPIQNEIKTKSKIGFGVSYQPEGNLCYDLKLNKRLNLTCNKEITYNYFKTLTFKIYISL